LGRGRTPLDKPSYDKCPFCGARFINGGGFGPRLMNPPSGPVTQPVPFPQPPVNVNPPTPAVPQPTQIPAWDDPSSVDSSGPSGDVALKTLAIGGGVAFVSLGLIGGIVFAVIQSSGGKKRRRRRRRRYQDDDWDDDD
jgi:hypothetical protein